MDSGFTRMPGQKLPSLPASSNVDAMLFCLYKGWLSLLHFKGKAFLSYLLLSTYSSYVPRADKKLPIEDLMLFRLVVIGLRNLLCYFTYTCLDDSTSLWSMAMYWVRGAGGFQNVCLKNILILYGFEMQSSVCLIHGIYRLQLHLLNVCLLMSHC